MTSAWLLLAVLAVLAGCKGDLGITLPPAVPPAPPPSATPPPAANAEEQRLFQLLYVGDGADSPVAQRARMLAWMASVALTDTQAVALLDLARRVQAEEAADLAGEADAARAEAAALEPVYADLVRLYARGQTPSELDLAPIAHRIAAGRSGVDPRRARYQHVYAALEAAAAWSATLARTQQQHLAECRFFLQASLGPLTTPGDYEEWLGLRWNGQDLAAFRVNGPPSERKQMDIAGLWAEDALDRQGPATGRKLAVLVLLAIRSAGLPEAVEVRIGRRAPEDYSAPGELSPAAPSPAR